MFNERNFEKQLNNSQADPVEQPVTPEMVGNTAISSSEKPVVPELPEDTESKKEGAVENKDGANNNGGNVQEGKDGEASARENIEKQFQEALGMLHIRLKLQEKLLGRFPKEKEILPQINITPALDTLTEWMRKRLAVVIERDKDMHSDNPTYFVRRGLQELALIIDLRAIGRVEDAEMQQIFEDNAAKLDAANQVAPETAVTTASDMNPAESSDAMAPPPAEDERQQERA